MAILAVAALVMAGCIDESDSRHRGGSQQGSTEKPAAVASTNITATLSEWTIELSRTDMPAGTVSFQIKNTGAEEHAFEIGGMTQEWKTEPIKPGESATLTLTMPAGSYEIYCPLASGGEAHADRGMKVGITVR